MLRALWMLLLSLLLSVPSLVEAKVRVVATLGDLASLAADVGGPNVEVTMLAAASEDPHYVDARPNLILALNSADLVVVNGLELEVGWLPSLLQNARNPRVQPGTAGYFDASAHVSLLEIPSAAVDRSHGDIHPGGNPHFTCDPRAGARIALALGDRLAAIDPPNADAYRRRARSVSDELTTFATEEARWFARLPADRRVVVTYHRSLVYLLDWLGLREVATVEPKPGIAPNPGHVAKVLEAMKVQRVGVILQEEFYPTTTSSTLARLVGGRVVVLRGQTRFDRGTRYIDHIRSNTKAIRDALAP